MSIGIIIGRFQTYKLHDGYEYLLEYVQSHYESYGILLGSSNEENIRNPLPFEPRKMMLEAYVKKKPIFIDNIMDVDSDVVWSNNLDNIIKKNLYEFLNNSHEKYKLENIFLIGSRDSFIKYYHGIFKTVEIDGHGTFNSTDMRNSIKTQYEQDFISGFNAALLKDTSQYKIHNQKWLEGYIFYYSQRF